MKNVKEFLTENRDTVITYYNENISTRWNISLSSFMMDTLNNFEKITTGEDLKKFDLFGNLQNAKSRLGIPNNEVGVKFDRDAYIAKKYSNTVFAQNLAL